MVASHRSPLRLKAVADSTDVVNHILAMTERLNLVDNDVVDCKAQVILLESAQMKAEERLAENLAQTQKLTKAIQELREIIVPNSEHRRELATLPDMDLSEIAEQVKKYEDSQELDRRRKESLRAKALTDEKNRDLRNVRWTLYATLFVGVATEIFRILFTHGF
jgi:hypothetical protein